MTEDKPRDFKTGLHDPEEAHRTMATLERDEAHKLIEELANDCHWAHHRINSFRTAYKAKWPN